MAGDRQIPHFNGDLAPVPIASQLDHVQLRRTLDQRRIASRRTCSSGLISAGMNWWRFHQSCWATIVLAPILLNSHPGTKYGIPFPVFARAAYGTLGSNVPALMRAVVACGWFGIQAWIGGEALHTLFKAVMPGWPTLLGGPVGGHTPTEWLSFFCSGG
jgi:NCS1 family nucleobase:cation symporter-1